MSKGVLLVNLGSPDSPSVPDVRRYLREFLMDPRVLDMNWLARFCVVNFAILPSRPKQTAEAYEKVWRADGSPLVAFSRSVQTMLRQRVSVPVELAMRYQNPSIPDAVGRLAQNGIDEVLLIPLFPHYAMSSFETAVERVKEVARRVAPRMRFQVQPPFFDQTDYIAALAASAREYLEMGYDHLLFSFHGLPERHLRKADPTGCHCLTTANCCEGSHPAHATCYRAQCFQTVEAFVRLTGVSRFSIAFQSRLGKDPWLAPSADSEIDRLARAGVRKLLVVCPAFVADCLETIEEIGMRGCEIFLAAGGRDFALIPCLNDNPHWITALEKMIAAWNSHGGRTRAAGSLLADIEMNHQRACS